MEHILVIKANINDLHPLQQISKETFFETFADIMMKKELSSPKQPDNN